MRTARVVRAGMVMGSWAYKRCSVVSNFQQPSSIASEARAAAGRGSEVVSAGSDGVVVGPERLEGAVGGSARSARETRETESPVEEVGSATAVSPVLVLCRGTLDKVAECCIVAPVELTDVKWATPVPSGFNLTSDWRGPRKSLPNSSKGLPNTTTKRCLQATLSP